MTVYQVGEIAGLPYIAQELIEGETLDRLLKAGRRFSIDEILHIGSQVAAGLAAAHNFVRSFRCTASSAHQSLSLTN